MIWWIIKKIFSFFKKSDSDEEKSDIKTGKELECGEIESTNKEETNQRTLYANSFGFLSKLCPYCDGENMRDSKKCNICGRELR